MKKSMILLLVLVGGLVAAPFGFSFWAESRLNGLLDDLNESGVVNFTVIKLDRGWFSTESIIEAEMGASLSQKMKKLSTADGETPVLILKNTIHHGPFPFIKGHFSPVPVVATMDTHFLKSISSDEPLVNMDYSMLTHLGLGGNSRVKVDIPEWDGPIESGKANMQWKGLQADLNLSKGLDAADITINAPYLNIKGETGSMLLESLTVDSMSTVGIEGLSLGSAQFKIAKIVIEDKKTGVDFSINDIGIDSETTATGDSINSVTQFNLATFTMSGEKFGPGVFSLAFRNLDAGAIARISNKYKEVSSQGNVPPEQMNMMLGATLLSEMSNLLQKGPEIEMSEISLGSSSGKLMGNARLTVDNSRPELLTNPMLIKDAIIGEVDLEIPEELLVAMNMAALRQEFKSVNIQYTEDQLQSMAKSRVSKRFAPLVAGNIFTKAGNMYKFSASFKNGVPTVNGKPFQIPLGGGMAPGK